MKRLWKVFVAISMLPVIAACDSLQGDSEEVLSASGVVEVTEVSVSAEIAGRRKYLAEKCDYVLPGSIARGSAVAERGHRLQVAALVKALAKCSTLPTK